MSLNTFDYKVEPGKDEEHGPTIHVFGTTFGEEFDERFECWAEIPANAAQTIDVIRFGDVEVPRADIIGTIERLLVTKRPEQKFVELPDGEDGEGETVTEWVKTDDVQRWRDMIKGDTIFVPIEALGNIYRDVLEILNERPTSRSRRT